MSGRQYRLSRWLIRALLPENAIGAYVLWEDSQPIYTGRSDTSLRCRLIKHSRVFEDAYFHVRHQSLRVSGFDLECSVYHALGSTIRNQIHPRRPGFAADDCIFCNAALRRIEAAWLPGSLPTNL